MSRAGRPATWRRRRSPSRRARATSTGGRSPACSPGCARTTWSGTTSSTTTCSARRRRRSTSSTGTRTRFGWRPAFTATSSTSGSRTRSRDPGAARGPRRSRSTSGAVDVDTYFVAGASDHIVPWESAYTGARLFGGNRRFVLSRSGHIQALVNPPGPEPSRVELPRRRRAAGGAGGVRRAGTAAPGQLVARLGRVAGRALGRAQGGAEDARQPQRTRRRRRRRGPMSSPTDRAPASSRIERWWGDHLRETRWQLELSRLLADPVFHGRGVPRGDGRPVILMPGFGGGDQTLLVLAAWLRRIGYRPHICGFVANTGCSDRACRARRAAARAAARAARTAGRADRPQPRRPLRPRARPPPPRARLARDLGRRRPASDARDQLPDAGGRRRRAARALRSGRARSPHCLTEACDCRFARDFAGPFPADRVRLTSIYSKGDGVVRWQAALVPYANCVEVTGSHVGLIFNRKTYRAIATALAEPELPNRWRTPMLTAPCPVRRPWPFAGHRLLLPARAAHRRAARGAPPRAPVRRRRGAAGDRRLLGARRDAVAADPAPRGAGHRRRGHPRLRLPGP